jgi:hypothetical protein
MKIFNISQYLARPVNTRSLDFLRIATGVVALVELLVLCPYWKDIYGSHGYIEWIISSNLFSMPNLPTMAGIGSLLNAHLITDDMIMYGVLSLYIVCLIGMTLGIKSNLMALFAWVLHLTINNSANMYGYGVETFIHVSLFYLIFIPSSSNWSVFPKENKHIRVSDTVYANVWLTILQIHLCLVYCNAGIAKIDGEDWRQGEALWRSVAQPSYGQMNMFWIANVPWISVISTYMVLVLETAYPVFIWFRFSKAWWLTGIILMHIGIGVFMGLYGFAAIMIVLNVAAFGWDFVENIIRSMSVKLRLQLYRVQNQTVKQSI